jgi:hypothetical protein
MQKISQPIRAEKRHTCGEVKNLLTLSEHPKTTDAIARETPCKQRPDQYNAASSAELMNCASSRDRHAEVFKPVYEVRRDMKRNSHAVL